MLIALGLILFVLLVVVHEYGHFISARRNGVEVEEFGIGFPPRAKVITKKNGTEYTLNWLPLGGFVKLKGENDSATEKGSFGAASFKKKTLILLAGVGMNWITAAFIFTIVAFIGMPQLLPNQFKVASDANITKQEVIVGYVEDGSPAQAAGIKQLDKILKIENTSIKSSEDLRAATSTKKGQKVSVTYVSDDEVITKEVILGKDASKGALGVSPSDNTVVKSTWSAPVVGVATTVQLTIETYKGLFTAIANLFTGHGGEASQSVTGPVGIFITLQALAKQGIAFVLFLIGVISLSLAVFNSLPIPALDGGRLFVMALYRVMKKPLTKETEEKIHGTGMLVLLILAAVITVIDIKRL